MAFSIHNIHGCFGSIDLDEVRNSEALKINVQIIALEGCEPVNLETENLFDENIRGIRVLLSLSWYILLPWNYRWARKDFEIIKNFEGNLSDQKQWDVSATNVNSRRRENFRWMCETIRLNQPHFFRTYNIQNKRSVTELPNSRVMSHSGNGHAIMARRNLVHWHFTADSSM